MAQPDYYDEGPDREGAPDADDQAQVQDESETETQTALLPKSFFLEKDLDPGVRCEVEIDRVLEDEVQVHYVPHDDLSPEKKEEYAEEPTEETPDEMYS